MLSDVLAGDEPPTDTGKSRLTRNQKIIALLTLSFLVPLALGMYIGYTTYESEPLRNWFWDYQPTDSEIVSYYPEPWRIGDRETMVEQDTFWYWYMDVSYSRSLRSYDGGPITIEAGDNPFADMSRQFSFPSYKPIEAADTFTFGDLWGNLTWWVTDWRPIQWLESNYGFSGNAAAANRFLTLDDADCVVTAIATDVDCWDDTTNEEDDGNGSGFLPTEADDVFADINSGTTNTTGTFDANMHVNSWDFTAFPSADIVDMSTFDLVVDGSIILAAGRLNKNTGGLQVQTLTISGGNLISTSGTVIVYGEVNISAAASYIDFGSETWTIYGEWTNSSTSASWDAGTGTVYFGYQGFDPSYSPPWWTVDCEFFYDMETLESGAFDDLCNPGSDTFDGTIVSGVTDQGGKIGQSRDFDGAGATPQVDVGDVDLTLPFTLAAWINLDASGGDTPMSIIAKDASGVAGYGLLIADDTNNLVRYHHVNSGFQTATSTDSVTDLTWAHVAAVVRSDGGSGTDVWLYINGVLDSGGVLNITNQLIANNVTTSVGGIFNDARDFNGGIDDMGVWNRALTSGEIRYLALQKEQGLQLYWNMETLTNSLVNDLSSNEGNGTITGALTGTGEIGGAYDFDGADDSVHTDTVAAFAENNIGSISVWLSVDTLAASHTYISFSNNGSNDDDWRTFFSDTNNTIQARLTVNGTDTMALESPTNTINDTNFHHIVWTSDGSTLALFVDGVSQSLSVVIGSNDGSWFFDATDADRFTAGGVFRATLLGDTDGQIDEVMVFDRVITAAEIDALGLDKDVTYANFAVDENEFNNLTVEVGDLTMATNNLEGVGGDFTLANPGSEHSRAATFAMATFEVNVTGNVIHSAGVVTIGASAALGWDVTGNYTMSGTASITMGTSAADADIDGNVDIQGTGNFIDFGSGTWNVGGMWTNAATTASWDRGTGSIIFDSGSSVTMTFASFAVAEDEFWNVSFSSTSGSAVVFTMATNALDIGGTLTITDSSSTTELDTAGLGIITGFTMAMDNAGAILDAGASTLTIGTNWQSELGDFQADTSTVSLGGTGTIDLETFYNLTITGGTHTVNGNITISNVMTISGGTYAKGTTTLTISPSIVDVLLMTGGDLTSTSGAVDINGGVNISSASSAISFGSETWNIGAAWTNVSTDSAVWDAGTGTVIFDSAGNVTMVFAPAGLGENEFNNVIFDSASTGTRTFTMSTNALLVANDFTVRDSNSGATLFDTSGSDLAVTVGGNVNFSDAFVTFVGNGSTITVAGDWDGTAGAFTVGTSTVDFNGTGNVAIEAFNNLTVSSGTRTATGAITVVGNMVISGGTFAKGTQTLDVTGGLTMSGGDLTSTSGNVTIGGNVDISSTASGIAFGSGNWTISGSYTSVLGPDSAVWDDGTATILFDSSTGVTITLGDPAGAAETEFFNVQFNSTAGTPVVFTLAGPPLRIGNDFTVSDSTSTTEVDSAAITTVSTLGDFTIGAGGIFDAGASSPSVTGNWSSTAGDFQEDTSTVFFTGTGTVDGETFFNVEQCTGTRTATGNVTVSNNMVIVAGTWAKGTTTLDVTGNLTMSGGDLTSTSGNVTVGGNVNISAAASAIDFGSETWTVSGTWTNASTDGAVWERGTGTITFDNATSGTMTFAPSGLGEDEFNNVLFASTASGTVTFTMSTNALLLAGNLTFTDATGISSLDTANLNITVGNDMAINSPGGRLVAGSSTITVGDVWTTSAGDFQRGTSTVIFDGSFDGQSDIVAFESFFNLTISGVVILTGQSTIGGDLSITTGSLQLTANQDIAITGDLLMSGGDLNLSGRSNAADISVNDVNISNAASAISFGDTDWIVTGTWTNISTDATFWDASTGFVTFTSATGGTMTFAGANMAEPEFNDITFDSTGTTQTFTMATRALRWDGTLTVSDASSTTELATADLGLGAATDTPALVVGNGGILTANNSTVILSTVTMTGGTSGILTLTGATWTVSGSWNTSGAGSIFTQGNSSVTFDATGTITLLSTDDDFNNLTILSGGGTVTAASSIDVLGLMEITSGTFAKGMQTLDVTNTLTMDGGDLTSTSGNVTVGGDVTIDPTSAIDFGSETWTVSGTWTNASTDGAVWERGTGSILFDNVSSSTMTFAPSGLAEDEFNNVTFNSTGTGAQVFTLATNVLRFGGTMSITDSTGTTEVDTGAGNIGITGGAITIGTNGIIDANAATLTLNGNFDFSVGTFTYDTSTVVFASAGTITSAGTASTTYVNSVTVNAGITMTLGSNIGSDNVLTLNGTSVIALGSNTFYFMGTAVTRFTVNATATSTATTGAFDWAGTVAAVNVPAWANYPDVFLTENFVGTTTYTLQGGMTAIDLTVANDNSGSTGIFDLNANNLTVTGNLDIGISGAGDGAITAGGVNVAITGTVDIINASSYITSTSGGLWTISGNWTNGSTNSVNWSFAAPITFDAASAQTIGGSGTQNIFSGTMQISGGAKAFTANFTTAAFNSITAARTVTLTDTITWTVTAGSGIAGASGAVMTLVSSTLNTQWSWSSTGTVTITFADIRDAAGSSVAAATTARFDATATSNVDSENNTYVEFNGSPVTEYVAARWYEDPDSYYWAETVTGRTSMAQFDVATDTGYYGTTVTIFAANETFFTVCSSVAGAVVTWSIGGLTALDEYRLSRDSPDIEVAISSTNSSGVWTNSVTGGWDTSCATNSMTLTRTALSGGGGGGKSVVLDFQYAFLGGPLGTAVKFTDISLTTVEIVSWTWDFGDGQTGTGKEVIHVYDVADTYTVTLTLTDFRGTEYSVSKTLQVSVERTPTIFTWWAINGWIFTAFVFLAAMIRKSKRLAVITFTSFATWSIFSYLPVVSDFLIILLPWIAGIPVPPNIPLPFF